MDSLSTSRELQPSAEVRIKGAWSKEEDDLLRKCIEKYGEGKWSSVPKRAGLKRCRKSCRLRWLNYLSPAIRRGKFNDDEVDLIVRLHRLLGNRWSLIAGRIPGRTANDIKNYWNSHLSKKLDAQLEKKKKKEAIVNARVVKPQPQRVSKLWTWPKDSQQHHDHQVISPIEPKPMMTVEQQEPGWLNELLNSDDIDTTDHDNILSSLDFQFGYELEQVMDEAVLSGGVIEWEKLLQETICSDD